MDSSNIQYLKIGNGARWVIVFAGYGQDAAYYNFLESEDCSIISFDFNNFINFKEDEVKPFYPEELSNLIITILRRNNVNHISLLGFSLGARVCLSLVPLLLPYIKNVVLVAADGLKPSWAYNFLTLNNIGRKLFKNFIYTGGIYIKFFKLIHSLRLVDSLRYKFAIRNVQTKEDRRRLYNVWVATSRLQFVNDKSKWLNNQITINLLMGRYDAIIPLKNAKYFKNIVENAQIKVYEKGHNLLNFEEVRSDVKKFLL